MDLSDPRGMSERERCLETEDAPPEVSNFLISQSIRGMSSQNFSEVTIELEGIF